MHALARRALVRVAAAVALATFSVAGDARGGNDAPPPETTAPEDLGPELEQMAESANPHAYRDVPQWRAVPAAGTELGYGAVIPSLHVPTYSFGGRLGIAFETPSRVALVLAGATGVTVAFNTGSSSPYYGYLIRVPLMFTPEVIYSRLVDYKHKRFMNFHVGIAAGGDFVLAAQCLEGACNYILPSTYFGLGARIGLSYSAVERSAVGLFVSWQTDFAPCPPSAEGNCATTLSTITWSLGWSLF
jgi:hypothetical protein